MAIAGRDRHACSHALTRAWSAVGTPTSSLHSTLRALDKLGQVLPERLRRRVAALQESFVATPFRGPQVDPDALTTLTAACEERCRVRFTYRDGQGRQTQRDVEPHGVVHTFARWYLVAWDALRDDWRTFRVDRIGALESQQARFTARVLPHGDLATFVAHSIDARRLPYQARIEFLAPQERIAQLLPWCAGQLTPLGKQRCLLETGEQELDRLAFYLATTEVDFVVHEPAALLEHMAGMAARLQRALQASAP